MSQTIIERAVKKASQSPCNYKVSAIGLDKKGRVIGATSNKHRFSKGKGEGFHAEHLLICRYGSNLKTIIICRVNKNGGILSIDPCPNCKKMADKLDIKIVSIKT